MLTLQNPALRECPTTRALTNRGVIGYIPPCALYTPLAGALDEMEADYMRAAIQATIKQRKVEWLAQRAGLVVDDYMMQNGMWPMSGVLV